MLLPSEITYADKVDGALDVTGDFGATEANEIKAKFNALQAFVLGLVDEKGILLNSKVPYLAEEDRPALNAVVDGRITLAGGSPNTAPNAAPTATVQAITGTPTVGQLLTSHYTYADAENNPEGSSPKAWFRADNTSGLNRVAIAGATGTTYTLTSDDLGKYIQFAVTPVSSAGTTTGTQVLSGYTAVIAAAGAARPTLLSAAMLSPNSFRFTFSEPMHALYAGFTFFKNGNYAGGTPGGNRIGDGTNQITFNSDPTYATGDTISVQYDPTGVDYGPNYGADGGTIYSAATGLELARVVSFQVTNTL